MYPFSFSHCNYAIMSVSGKSDRIIRSSLHFPSNLRRLGHDSVTLHESWEHNFELSFLSHNHGLSCWRKKVQLGRPRPRARSHAWERRCVVGRCARASEPAPGYLSWGGVSVIKDRPRATDFFNLSLNLEVLFHAGFTYTGSGFYMRIYQGIYKGHRLVGQIQKA